MNIKRAIVAAGIGLAGIHGMAAAAVGAEEAAKLGKTLTPLGAEKAGNKDGSIPAWDGGLTKARPASRLADGATRTRTRARSRCIRSPPGTWSNTPTS